MLETHFMTATATQETLFLIGGAPEVGKTTFRKLMSEYTELPGGSCSDVVYAIMATRTGKTVEELRAMPKSELRPKLVELGNAICDADPAYLVRYLYERGVRIVDGIRRKEELAAVLKEFSCVGVWIVNPRAAVVTDNTELTAADFPIVIQNDGTVDELALKVADFAIRHRKKWLSS